MNKIQNCIVEILNHSLRGNNIENLSSKSIDWNEMMEECRQHQISSLIYSGISKQYIKNIDEEILEKWKKETFMSGIYQINHIKQVSKVFEVLNKNNIQLVALKGLVVRDLYPRSELRTMGDADILIRKEDFEKVNNILIDMGYKEEGKNAFHVEYGNGNSHIEVHWTLANEQMFNGIVEFKEETWNRAVDVEIGCINVLSMCDEDLLLYSCIHMAKHLINSGFGIRQICDVLLIVEKRGEYIDWNSFIDRAKRSGVYKFTMSIFAICNKLFNMEIPKELIGFVDINNSYIDELIDAIWENGVHGKKDISAIRVRQLTNVDSEKRGNWTARMQRMYFPTGDALGNRYVYAKNNKFLLPIAWLHRMIYATFRNDYSVADKVKLSVQGPGICKTHSELLSWLEL